MLADRLPSMGGHLAEARRNDPEFVQLVMGLPEEGTGQWRPDGADWTIRDELTAGLFDRVGTLLAVQESQRTGKPPKVPQPFPRPMRAIDLARAEADEEYFADLDDEVAAAQARWEAQEQREEGDDAER